MEQKQRRERYDAFAQQFITILPERWPDILLVLNCRVWLHCCVLQPRRNSNVSMAYGVSSDGQRILSSENLCQPRFNETVAMVLLQRGTLQFALDRRRIRDLILLATS